MVECYNTEMGQINQDYGYKQRLMDKIELDHVTQVIGYHPSYLEHFLKLQNFVLRGDGPLPYVYRHYLAIMAAARHQCTYLINLHTKEFMDQGGDPSWLKGLDFIPPKLRAIYDINKILAHRPWLLNTQHIEQLTKGKNNWSLSEVVHAIVLLSHFHSLSSFVYSCGHIQELNNAGNNNSNNNKISSNNSSNNGSSKSSNSSSSSSSSTSSSSSSSSGSNNSSNSCCSSDGSSKVNGTSSSPPSTAATICQQQNKIQIHNIPIATQKTEQINNKSLNSADLIKQEVSVDVLMVRMKVLSEKQDECSETELSNRFKNVEKQAAELPAIVENKPQVISHLVDDPNFTYQDFARRGNTENIPSTFRIQDYSWDDHGYSLVNRLYNDVGHMLDDKFRAAYNLTYFTMADRTNVDTSKFRRAIWNYIQCIFGIRHDDYDYGEVNQLLERSLKMFIKTACCFPERITKKDYDSILTELQHSEKVHINLMILEARNQAELLYSLREIMRYMT